MKGRALDIKDVRKMREEGRRLGRAGLSQRVIDLVGEFDGSYKGAMELAGRLRVIATAVMPTILRVPLASMHRAATART